MFINLSIRGICRASTPVLACAVLVAGCGKEHAPASGIADMADKSGNAMQQAASQFDRAAQQAAAQLDRAASFVNGRVDAARANARGTLDTASSAAAAASASTAELASSARTELRDAASAGRAMVGHVAAATGNGLQLAGRSIEQWASRASAAGAVSDTASANPASGAGH